MIDLRHRFTSFGRWEANNRSERGPNIIHSWDEYDNSKQFGRRLLMSIQKRSVFDIMKPTERKRDLFDWHAWAMVIECPSWGNFYSATCLHFARNVKKSRKVSRESVAFHKIRHFYIKICNKLRTHEFLWIFMKFALEDFFKTGVLHRRQSVVLRQR